MIDQETIASVQVSFIRGGTSKGVYMRLGDLPPAGPERDALALAMLGSPDPMQLDGLGGTYSSTSKLMAVDTAEVARDLGYEVPEGVDIAYLFGQIAIAEPVVDWRGNCGNLTAGVPLYAIDEGMIPTTDPLTSVELFNINTGVRVRSSMPTANGRSRTEGDFAIAGVPGTGARIDLSFMDPARGLTRQLLPTGQVRDSLELEGMRISATILDVTNPVVVVHARDLGIEGIELPTELNADPAFLRRVETVRAQAAVLCGLVDSSEQAKAQSPAVPRVIMASAARAHSLVGGEILEAAACDVVVRNSSLGVIHHAFTGTGLMAAAVAALLPGSVLNEVSGAAGTDVRLAHPKGVVTVSAGIDTSADTPRVLFVSIPRTARCLMNGTVYPSPVTPSAAWLAERAAGRATTVAS